MTGSLDHSLGDHGSCHIFILLPSPLSISCHSSPHPNLSGWFSNRVFGWGLGRVGMERTRSRSCFDGSEEGWVGSKGEYSLQMWVGLLSQNLADGAAPTGLGSCQHLALFIFSVMTPSLPLASLPRRPSPPPMSGRSHGPTSSSPTVPHLPSPARRATYGRRPRRRSQRSSPRQRSWCSSPTGSAPTPW